MRIHFYKDRRRNIAMDELSKHRLLSRKEAANFLGG